MKNNFLVVLMIMILTMTFKGYNSNLAIESKDYEGIGKEEVIYTNDEYFSELTIDELEEKINNKDSFILVVSQSTCSHCAEYKPRFEAILKEYKINAYYIEMDLLDEKEDARLEKIVSVSGTPTTVFFSNGVEESTSTRIVGARDDDTIVSKLKDMGYIS